MAQETTSTIGQIARRVSAPGELLGADFETELTLPDGSRVSAKVGTGVLVQAALVAQPGPNNRKDLRKAVRFYDETHPLYTPGQSTLTGLNTAFLCRNTTCNVVFGPDGTDRVYEVLYDLTGPLQVYEDASFTGPTSPARWVLVEESSGGDSPFPADFTVSLSGGKTLGRFVNGQTVPAAGKTARQVLLDAAIEAILPTYSVANEGITQSAPADGEVGESIANTLTATFNRNDAGALVQQRIYRNGTQVANGASSSNPFSRQVTMVRSLTPSGLYAVADYGAGVVKNVPPANTPDTRSPAVRNPNAPQAAETGLQSSVMYFTGYYRLFYGAASEVPNNSTTARALPQSQLTNAGNAGTVLTGTSATRFAIILPPGRTLTSVTDLDNQNLNLLSKYVAQPTISVADAGGTLVPGYTPYVLTTVTPYSISARHAFTYA